MFQATWFKALKTNWRPVSRYIGAILLLASLGYGLSAHLATPASASEKFSRDQTYSEQESIHHPVNTFTDYHNASGEGPAIGTGQVVQVTCKVLDYSVVTSVYPDGYWYLIASAPWNNNYYAAANTFLNGDPPNGPYSHNTDFAVPDCGSSSPPPPVSTSTSTAAPTSTTTTSPSTPVTTPTSTSSQLQGYSEEESIHHSVNTFTDYHNASGEGPAIAAAEVVQVSCKVLDGTIPSVNPDGYWYRIASDPWDNNYYAAANTFLNGDPPNGPYSHNTDFGVPDCPTASGGSQPPGATTTPAATTSSPPATSSPGSSPTGGSTIPLPTQASGTTSVFYSPTAGVPGGLPGLSVSQHDLPKGSWYAGGCKPGNVVGDTPSGASVLAGWSFGRLGPIYFLAYAGAARVAQVHTIIVFDPGSTADMSPCDSGFAASTGSSVSDLLARWLKSNSANRLLIFTGYDTEEHPDHLTSSLHYGWGTPTYHGLWTYYFPSIWNKPFANQALVCDYNNMAHSDVLNNFSGSVNAALYYHSVGCLPFDGSTPRPWNP